MRYKLKVFPSGKFKTISIELCFIEPYPESQIEYRNIAAKILIDGWAKNSFLGKISNVYLTSGVRIENNMHKIIIHLQFLAPNFILNKKYTVKDIINEFIHILFEKSISYEMYKNALNYLVRESVEMYNNKESYIYLKILEKSVRNTDNTSAISFREPCCYQNTSWEIMKEVLSKIRNENLIEVYCIGNVDTKEIESIFNNNIFMSQVVENTLKTPNPLIYMKGNAQEFQKIPQSKLAKSYLIPDELMQTKRQACKLFGILLGGGTNSKLFKNVRVKNGLVYHISAALNEEYNLICVCAGTQKNHLDKVDLLIHESIEELKNGVFEEKDLESAKLLYIQQLTKDSDCPFKFLKMSRCSLISFERLYEKIMEITKTDIITIANIIKPLYTFKVISK